MSGQGQIQIGRAGWQPTHFAQVFKIQIISVMISKAISVSIVILLLVIDICSSILVIANIYITLIIIIRILISIIDFHQNQF